jgi:signal peptide peptidase SppA
MTYILWAGSPESYEVVERARIGAQTMAKELLARGGDQPDTPKGWTKSGDLAIVPVSGSLINGHAGWLSFFGVTGYDDIASALTQAVMDPDVKSILLDVSSGGGQASGAQPLADYVAQVGAVKPTSAHIDDVGASAAYWVASAAPGGITVSPMGIAGSIGAVQIHTSYARQLAADGVDKTVIRSGEFKMLGNPYETLTDTAKAEMQAQVNDVNALFEAQVAKVRGVPVADGGTRMGQGRTFLGQRAVAAGLVDKVQTRDQAVAAAKNR